MGGTHARGLFTLDELAADGHGDEAVAEAVRSGRAVNVAPGLVTTKQVQPRWEEALLDGWRPTCLTAADLRGLWVPPSRGTRMHGYRERTSRASAPPGILPHGWHDGWPEDDSVASIPLLLDHAARCLDTESAVVLAESALNQRLITLSEWRSIVRTMPKAKQPGLSRATTVSQSGSETRVRLAFELRGIPLTPQVVIDGVGRVDLVVRDIWVIECDSRQYHSSEEAYATDRHRDLTLQSMGYLVTRLSYPQIWTMWERTRPTLFDLYQRIRRRKRIVTET